MKNLILSIALGLVLLTSCSKDESLETTELQTIESVYVLNQNNNSASWDTMIIDSPQNEANYAYDPNISYRYNVEGLYMSAPQNGMTLQWTGEETNHGIYGSAEFKQITPYFNFHFKMETECISIEGKEAVYGGVITQIISLVGDVPQIEEGWRFYFKVIDNGFEGNPGGIPINDQLSNKQIFASPMMPLLCNGYSPSSYIWASEGYTEITLPGFVTVEQLN